MRSEDQDPEIGGCKLRRAIKDYRMVKDRKRRQGRARFSGGTQREKIWME